MWYHFPVASELEQIPRKTLLYFMQNRGLARMNDWIISGLSLIIGIYLYAAWNHLTLGFGRLRSQTHLVFAFVVLSYVVVVATQIAAYRAGSILELAMALKVNILAIMVFFLFFVWFIAFYTGFRPLSLLLALNAWSFLLIAINLASPYGLQFKSLTGIEAFPLAWGEILRLPVGTISPWLFCGVALVAVCFGYVYRAFYVMFCREGRNPLAMFFAVNLLIIGLGCGVIARIFGSGFIVGGPFAFGAMIIAMSAVLTHETKERLRASERRFRLLIEQAPDAIVVLDLNKNRFINANPAAERLFGCSFHELLRRDPLSFFAVKQPDLRDVKESMSENTERAMAGQNIDIERIMESEDGRKLFCEVRLVKLPSEIGRLLRVSITDITERKQLELDLNSQKIRLEDELVKRQKIKDALLESQRVVTNLIRNLPGLAYRCQNDPDRNMEFVSDGGYLLTGFHADELVKNRVCSFGSLIYREDENMVFDAVQEALSEKHAWQIEYRIRHRNGNIRWVWERGNGIFDSMGELNHLEGFIVDITDRKNLEEQLYQSQKMESIGRMAGGVAHDFNNMLSVILGAAQIAMPKVPEGSELQQLLQAIMTAAERSSGITRQLLAFSRKEAIVPKAINLNAHLTELKKNLERLICEDVEISFHLAQDLWTVKMDPSQLDQILMNLSVNARDAMPVGGSLVMETANVHVEDDYCHLYLDARPGDYVLLTVNDTGCGMDRETLKHIFEPFFTTKAIGEGTGLGLSTVYGIVTQNAGFIICYSEMGQGTTFNIYLPRLIDGVVEPKETKTEKLVGTGTILLVEDEEILIGIAAKLLEDLGYTVIQAQSPQLAISICEQNNQPIDMILTDVIMPGMNGKVMVERIKAVRPGLKVMFMSGYTADIVTRRGIVEEGTHFIPKPLEKSRLHAKISQVLRGTAECRAVLQNPAIEEAHLEPGLTNPLMDSLTEDRDVIELFCIKAPEYAGQIRIGVLQGDLEKVRFFSHKLKGAAAATGCYSLARTVGNMEEVSELGDSTDIEGMLHLLDEELEQLLSVLKCHH